MIVTDADRRAVLRHYRAIRTRSANPPNVVMGMVRDVMADLVLGDITQGRKIRWEDARRWQAAVDYCETMFKRPDYWWRAPK